VTTHIGNPLTSLPTEKPFCPRQPTGAHFSPQGPRSQPSQSLIKSICYPHLFKLNTKAIQHGCKYEDYAIRAYEAHVKKTHINSQLTRSGLFINKEHPFLHATPDFLTLCDCCGLGCGEAKCPISIQEGDFEKYAEEKSSCLEKGSWFLKVEKRT